MLLLRSSRYQGNESRPVWLAALWWHHLFSEKLRNVGALRVAAKKRRSALKRKKKKTFSLEPAACAHSLLETIEKRHRRSVDRGQAQEGEWNTPNVTADRQVKRFPSNYVYRFCLYQLTIKAILQEQLYEGRAHVNWMLDCLRFQHRLLWLPVSIKHFGSDLFLQLYFNYKGVVGVWTW